MTNKSHSPSMNGTPAYDDLSIFEFDLLNKILVKRSMCPTLMNWKQVPCANYGSTAFVLTQNFVFMDFIPQDPSLDVLFRSRMYLTPSETELKSVSEVVNSENYEVKTSQLYTGAIAFGVKSATEVGPNGYSTTVDKSYSNNVHNCVQLDKRSVSCQYGTSLRIAYSLVRESFNNKTAYRVISALGTDVTYNPQMMPLPVATKDNPVPWAYDANGIDLVSTNFAPVLGTGFWCSAFSYQ